MTTFGLLITLLILFVAALVKATLGFGESLLAIPLLTLVLAYRRPRRWSACWPPPSPSSCSYVIGARSTWLPPGV